MATATPWYFCVSSWHSISSTSWHVSLPPFPSSKVALGHAQGTRVTDTPGVCLAVLVDPGSFYFQFPFPGLFSLFITVHISLYLPSPCHRFSPSHRDAGCICGISLIISKTYIYTVCSVNMCVGLVPGTMGCERVFKALDKKSGSFREPEAEEGKFQV